MQTEQSMSAIEAMKLSSQEDRIVHLEWTLGLERDLRADADDHASAGDTLEFWGSDWRVHLESVPTNAPDIDAIVDADDFAERVEKLRQEAGQAGDLAMVNICSKALGGDTAASAECAKVMLDAQAMADDEAKPWTLTIEGEGEYHKELDGDSTLDEAREWAEGVIADGDYDLQPGEETKILCCLHRGDALEWSGYITARGPLAQDPE